MSQCHIVLAIFLTLSCNVVLAEEITAYDIYLTSKVENKRPTTERMTHFDCSDRIHVVITATGLSTEKHALKVKWIDPVESQRELTRYDFYGQPTTTYIWAWLQLHGPTGAILGQMFDPSFGMEEFIGEWRAEVLVDGELVSAQPFQVLC